MSAEIIPARTQVEQALVSAFESIKARLPGDGRVRKLREEAFAGFAAAGLPHRRVESWHYTDLRALMREALPVAAATDKAAIERLRREFSQREAPRPRIVLVDGIFVPELSDALPEGIKVRSLSETLSEGRADLIAKLAPEGFPLDPILALNAAMMQDGAVIEAAPGVVVAEPVNLIYASASHSPVAVFSRSLLLLGPGASLRLFESSSDFGAPGQSFGCLIVHLGEGARLKQTTSMTGMAAGALRIDSLLARLGAKARYENFALVASGGLVRRQIFLRFEGSDAEASLRGVSLLRGRQHADTTLFVEHAAPECVGRQAFRYILDEDAEGVFQGRIRVAPLAQKTDARMLSKALLLSDRAVMSAKPELEIFADDVACGHGATSGGLSADQLFYMQTRGLSFAEAEALLLEAFAGELIDDMGQDDLIGALRAEVVAWLAARASRGEALESAIGGGSQGA